MQDKEDVALNLDNTVGAAFLPPTAASPASTPGGSSGGDGRSRAGSSGKGANLAKFKSAARLAGRLATRRKGSKAGNDPDAAGARRSRREIEARQKRMSVYMQGLHGSSGGGGLLQAGGAGRRKRKSADSSLAQASSNRPVTNVSRSTFTTLEPRVGAQTRTGPSAP